MEIEELAKKLFEYYGLRHTGIKPNWTYLKKERKLEWVEDVQLIAEALLTQLKSKVKPFSNPPNMVNTSYAMGLMDGIRQERVNMISLLDEIEKEVEEEIFSFKEGME